MARRRQQEGLQRVLGANALFATAYGNVGSSIYYALGVTAAFALGLTPIVFIIAGVIFAMTAATYAEGTVRYPEAGGSASFARHAFNEVVSFGAGWAQLLNYVITIAISAFFVPHYLKFLWEPLNRNPWDVIVAAGLIVVLVGVNIVGAKEAARLNIVLAAIDFTTQALLVIVGFVLIFSPEILLANVDLGTVPTWSNFFLAVPLAMIAYTGIETISNLSEEARDPSRDIPRAIRLVAIAVYAIYFTLPAIALSALPVDTDAADPTTLLGEPPQDGGFANDPISGVVQNLGLEGLVQDTLRIYIGCIAATILFAAANAGVIGASRIAYSMASYRQLPDVFRRLHPRFGTPWLALVLFAGGASILALLPGQTDFLGTMYSFGAMLSFTVAHVSLVALRVRQRDVELVYRSRPNLRLRGIDWPLFAVVGGLATGLAWLVVVVQEPLTRWAGLGWLAIGFVVYMVYRGRVLHLPLRETSKAPAIVLGPSLAIAYRSIVVPVVRSTESEEALITAARLAAERRSRVAVVHVVEIPMELPLTAVLPEVEREANSLLDDARALVESYGVRAVTRLERARAAGPAIVADVVARDAELVVMGAARRGIGRRAQVFGPTVRYVMKHSPCRVMVVAARTAPARVPAAA
ncbi:MAG TPA: universal stress protein [Miltoncostaeaceae bacterium]|nr:universal stress protein [Miltoncostaeaceae bacterium]